MKVIIAKYILIIISSIFYVLVGIKHFIDPNFFLAIVPPYLPYHLELVYISGLFEILFGVMILFPKYRYWGSVGLILLLIAVFPANIYLFQSVEAQKSNWSNPRNCNMEITCSRNFYIGCILDQKIIIL